MNPIIKMLKDLNVDDNKIKELFEAITTNPMMAMNVIGSLGIEPAKLQELMTMVMTNPSIIKEAVAELGLDMSAVEKAKEKLQNN